MLRVSGHSGLWYMVLVKSVMSEISKHWQPFGNWSLLQQRRRIPQISIQRELLIRETFGIYSLKIINTIINLIIVWFHNRVK